MVEVMPQQQERFSPLQRQSTPGRVDEESGSLIQKVNIAPSHIPLASEEKSECIMSQVGCSAEAQPTEQSAIQPESQSEARPDSQPSDQTQAQSNNQCHTESVSAILLYPLVGLEAQVLFYLGPRSPAEQSKAYCSVP